MRKRRRRDLCVETTRACNAAIVQAALQAGTRARCRRWCLEVCRLSARVWAGRGSKQNSRAPLRHTPTVWSTLAPQARRPSHVQAAAFPDVHVASAHRRVRLWAWRHEWACTDVLQVPACCRRAELTDVPLACTPRYAPICAYAVTVPRPTSRCGAETPWSSISRWDACTETGPTPFDSWPPPCALPSP